MPLSSRATIVFCFLALIVWFLEPTFAYYVFTPEKLKKIVENNKKQDTNLSEKEKEQLETALSKKNRAVSLGLDIKGGVSILIGIDSEAIEKSLKEKNEEYTRQRHNEIIAQVISGLKNRINQFGLADITLRKMGNDNISIQISGLQDIERIVKIIEQQGDLRFHFINETETQNLDTNTNSSISKNSKLHYFVEKNDQGIIVKTNPVVLYNKTELDGNYIKNANVYQDDFGRVTVGFELSPEGADIFSDVTANNIGKRLAITLDDGVISAPQINAIISNRGQIQGDFGYNEAKDLALILRSGSLPVPIKILSTNIVGPTMGKELLRKSFLALIYGFIAILIFILVRYKSFGLIACFALIINSLMIFSILAQMNFTVSLPSIAGVLLTVGISIDANVIIFERIKQEFRESGNFIISIENGYNKAFWSIFDANITTLISALILAYFGDNFVEGFAFTLFIGVLSSMFSALFMTRFIFDFMIYFKWLKQYKKWYL